MRLGIGVANSNANYNTANYNLLFQIERSIRYYQYRCQFYEFINAFTTFLSLLFGTTTLGVTIVELATDFSLKFILLLVSVLVIAWSILNLVIGTSHQAKKYGELAQRLIRLTEEFTDRNLSENKLAAIKREKSKIEQNESVLLLLAALCHLDLLALCGDSVPHPKVPWWNRYMAYFLNQSDLAEQISYELAGQIPLKRN